MESSFMRSLLSVGVLCSANQHLFISDMILSLSPNYHQHGRRRRRHCRRHMCPEIQVIRCKPNFDIQPEVFL